MTNASRLRMTGYAALQLLLAVPALLLFVLDVVGGALALIVVGLGILLVTLPATRWLADVHRDMAADVLGSPVPAAYRPTEGLSAARSAARPGRRPDDLA